MGVKLEELLDLAQLALDVTSELVDVGQSCRQPCRIRSNLYGDALDRGSHSRHLPLSQAGMARYLLRGSRCPPLTVTMRLHLGHLTSISTVPGMNNSSCSEGTESFPFRHPLVQQGGNIRLCGGAIDALALVDFGELDEIPHPNRFSC